MVRRLVWSVQSEKGNGSHRARAWVVLFLAPCAIFAQKKPDPDPLTLRLNRLASAGPSFKSCVFAGEQFPECTVDPALKLEELIGPFTLRTRFFDNEVTEDARASI